MDMLREHPLLLWAHVHWPPAPAASLLFRASYIYLHRCAPHVLIHRCIYIFTCVTLMYMHMHDILSNSVHYWIHCFYVRLIVSSTRACFAHRQSQMEYFPQQTEEEFLILFSEIRD